jgi:hypothetical protein
MASGVSRENEQIAKANSARQSKSKESLSITIKLFFEICRIHTAQFRNSPGDVHDVFRFVGPDFAIGFGREERRIGFDHDAVCGDDLGCPRHFTCVRESHHTGKADPRAEIQHGPGFGLGPRKAVEHEAGGIELRKTSKHRKYIIKRLAAVHDDRFIDSLGSAAADELKLLTQHAILDPSRWVVVMIVQPQLAPSHAFWVLGREFDQLPINGLIGMQRVNSRTAPEVFVRSGQIEHTPAIGGGGRNRDRPAYTHCQCLGKDLIRAA